MPHPLLRKKILGFQRMNLDQKSARESWLIAVDIFVRSQKELFRKLLEIICWGVIFAKLDQTYYRACKLIEDFLRQTDFTERTIDYLKTALRNRLGIQ